MSVNIKINFQGLEKEADRKIERGVNEVLSFLKEYAEKESPIDTGEYNENHKISGARDDGKTISGRLYNKTPYANILEYGVGGAIYGYHRYGKLYMAGVGARVYTRTQDNNIKKIVEIIRKNLHSK